MNPGGLEPQDAPQEPQAAAGQEAPSSSSESPEQDVLSRLLATYPELRDDRLAWQDVNGMAYVAVPDPLWQTLSVRERAKLAKELDSTIGPNWTVVTGRYLGSGKMTLDEHHPRAELARAP